MSDFIPSAEMPPLHEFAFVETGNLYKETVNGYTITRKEFLEAVEKTLDTVHCRSEVAEIIAPAIAVMDRFAVSSWATDRGCGCIIGEAVVAQDLIDRSDMNKLSEGVISLLQETYRETLAWDLLDFGNRIDFALTGLVPRDSYGVRTWPAHPSEKDARYERVIFILDEEN